ncbi:VirB10/TraB/TrbI family type IV secretion system protein [Dickeya dadantii]|uniref:VirB10/TraB/TrbI family type IV secretion system protein n=1 Tax=Dickeya dadantii TaxID=204038 RepID=UPI0003A8DED0|nr:VirB10/TraB/TrbI family type IV secretion system protein [Dickeya dadantii]
MTDHPIPDTAEKTVAEREAEARERASAARESQTPAHNSPPGQPDVTRFKKPASRRTLLVSLLSLAVLMLLAWSGDRFFGAVKHSDDKATESQSQPPTGAIPPARKNLGMDRHPFGLFEQSRSETTTDHRQTQAAPSPPAPPALNKATALADGLSQASDTASASHITASGTDKQKPTTAPDPEMKDATPGVATVTHVRRLGLDPDLYLPVDSDIPCSMMQRFVSDVGGRISCLISEDVYSASHHVKLLPAGTIARGIYRTGALQQGRSRMFVIWTALRTPEPGSLQISLTDTEATGPLGEAGISGRIDTHFWERFGNALMLSTVQDVAAAAANTAPGKDRNTDYTENTRAAASEMAKTALENSINIPPTMYLNQGEVIGIMTGTDIDFSSVYQLHLKKRWYER